MEDSASSCEERAEELKQQGTKDYSEGRYEKALELFTQAIAISPSNGVFYGNRSATLFQLQRWRECVADCKAASDNGKRGDIKIHVRGHKAIMKVAASDDDLQTALEFLQAALVCDPRNAEVKADLDLIKRVQKTRAEAPQLLEKQPASCLRDVEAALRSVPQHFKLQVLRLQCLSRADKHQQVIEGSRELITQNQDDFELLLCRGQAFLCIGEVDKAKNHLKKALSFDPDNPHASRLWKTAKMMDGLKQEGNDAFKAGNIPQAIDAYTRAMYAC